MADVNAPQLSDSSVQQAAERTILEAAAEVLGCGTLAEKPAEPFRIGSGPPVQVDGVSRDRSVLVEAYARQGRLRGAQFHKVARDILKLSLLKTSYPVDRAVIAFASAEARDSVKGWLEAAADTLGIELLCVDISVDERAAILAAQARQVMVNIPVGDLADDVDAIEEYPR